MLFRIASLLWIVSAWTAPILAQGAPASVGGSDATLIVRVTYENDRSSPKNLRVELVSAFGPTVDTKVTDGLGSVNFQHVPYGRYKLRVTNVDGTRTETDQFELTKNEAVHTEFVRVKRETSPSQGGIEATVAAADMNVPSKAKKEFDQGSERLEKKSWAEAKDHFERAIALYPQYAAARSRLGLAYANLGQGDKAVATFEEALKLDEHQAAANVYLGQFYYDNQKFPQAVPYLERAAAAEPVNPQIFTALANAQLRIGKLDAALASARKVHSIPDHKKFAVSHLIAAEILSSRGESKDVIGEYKLFLQEDPKSPLAPRVREALAKVEGAPK